MTAQTETPQTRTIDFGSKMRQGKKYEPTYHDVYRFNNRTFKEKNDELPELYKT
jgi:hypothetical protein